MNCKQGDLAVIVRDDIAPDNIGNFVTVLTRAIADEIEKFDGEEWLCVSCSWLLADGDSGLSVAAPGLELAFHDCDLRPIRDPGEDAQDETLSWLPVPHKEHT